MKKKKSLCLSAVGAVITASATTAGVLLTKTSTKTDVSSKSKSIVNEKKSLNEGAIVNEKENLLDEIKNDVPNDATEIAKTIIEDEIKTENPFVENEENEIKTEEQIAEKISNEENKTKASDNENIQEDETITTRNVSKQAVQPSKILITENTESRTTGEIETNVELNTDTTPIDLETLSFENRNKTASVEIQSLPTAADFKAKIVDEIRKQRGFSTLKAHHIEITWNDKRDILDTYFTEQKAVLTSWITIKSTSVEESIFTGTKDIQIHWLNKKFSWESLASL